MRRGARKGARALRALVALAVLVGVTGCGGSDLFGTLGLKKKKDRGTGESEDGVDDDGNKITKTINNSGSDFQVKDVVLLRNSIDSCIGPGMLGVTEDMLLPPNSNDPATVYPDGRIQFLLPVQYVTGDDIIEKEKGNMVDLSAGARTGISADTLTDTYLRSLETVANVVAHHCDGSVEACNCTSKERAGAMLSRCLPGMDPETKEMDEAAEMLGLVCAEDGDKGIRKAIASMLSSYSFAGAR